MRTPNIYLFLLSFLSALSVATEGKAIEDDPWPKTLQMTTLEWPPYAGALGHGGAVGALLRSAFVRQGLYLNTTSYPWHRATREAMTRKTAVGYYTATQEDCLLNDGLLSEVVAYRQTYFAQHLAFPLPPEGFRGLSGQTFGKVTGYDPGLEIRSLEATGHLSSVTGDDEERLLRLLVARRLEAVAIDYLVFDYLTARDPYFAVLDLYPQSLKPADPIYACFENTPRGAYYRDQLNRGLKDLDFEQEWRRWLQLHSVDPDAYGHS
ncbi:hypothetical protein ACTL6U_12775 [Rhodovibrionaceae bacterium A322]